MNYMLEDGSRALEVATTRPETMFGDVAVAVNPEDPRYKAVSYTHLPVTAYRPEKGRGRARAAWGRQG